MKERGRERERERGNVKEVVVLKMRISSSAIDFDGFSYLTKMILFISHAKLLTRIFLSGSFYFLQRERERER